MLPVILQGSSLADYPQLSNYVRSEPVWGSALIPRQPAPELFGTYDEYRSALLNWLCAAPPAEALPHPREVNNFLGVDYNPPSIPVWSEPANIDPLDFTRDCFLPHLFTSAQSNSIPRPESIQNVYDRSAKGRVVKWPQPTEQYCFVSKVSSAAILSVFCQQGLPNSHYTRDFIKWLPKFRVLCDPSISQVLRDVNPNELPGAAGPYALPADPDILTRIEARLCSDIGQLHIIRCNGARARVFLLLNSFLRSRPLEILSFLFFSPQLVCNLTRLYLDFSEARVDILPFVTYENMRDDIGFCALYHFVLIQQMLTIIHGFFTSPGDANVRRELERHERLYLTELNKVIQTQPRQLEASFTESIEIGPAEAHSIVLRLLLRFEPKAITIIFASQQRAFFVWLGLLALNPATFRCYARIAADVVSASPEVQSLFLSIYFDQTRRPASRLQQTALARASQLVGDLLNDRRPFKRSLDCVKCQSAFLNTIQLMSLDSMRVIYLIAALCRVYAAQAEAKIQRFREMFAQFRIISLQLFAVAATPQQTVALLSAVQPLLASHGPDKTDFCETFLLKLFGMMSANEEEVTVTAWKTFRKWLAVDPGLEKCIFNSELLKKSLYQVARCISDSPSPARDVLESLIEDHENKGILRLRSATASLLSPIVKSYSQAEFEILKDV
jgi:hypothetical protein